MQLAHEELFKGVAVIFDDEVESEGTVAHEILLSLRGRGLPTLTYTQIPDDGGVALADHLHGVSFIVLDWLFNTTEDGAGGVKGESENLLTDGALSGGFNPGLGASFKESEDEGLSIEFLKWLLQKTYCPIFVITTKDRQEILQALSKAGIPEDEVSPRICICLKNEVKDAQLLWKKLDDWVGASSSIYVLKTWERAARISKLGMLAELESGTHDWAGVLWNGYKDDLGEKNASDRNRSYELTHTLNTVLANRILLRCEYDGKYVCPQEPKNDCIAIKKIYEAERYISNIDVSVPLSPGDLFCKDGAYYLNVRAQCDTLRIDSPRAVLIPGKEIAIADIGETKDVAFRQGQLYGKSCEFVIPFLNGGKIVKFDMKDVRTREVDSKFKKSRIGRILPPFITRAQELLSAFLTREALPGMPGELFAESEKKADK